MEPFTNHRITTAAAGLIVGMIIAMSICLLQSTFAG
jgi:ABC-type Fe3+-siderophore transport system permease subunit